MSEHPTLHSRLKVLVAKTFRAEKLYGSIRNSAIGVGNYSAVMNDISNDIRAREWQRSHHQLRSALNALLGERAAKPLGAAVVELRNTFQQRSDESDQALKSGTTALIDAVKRSEFAHAMKLSLELIRHRARVQANQVIADELSAVLAACGASTEVIPRESSDVAVSAPGGTPRNRPAELIEGQRSNVIPLSRKVGAASRLFRS